MSQELESLPSDCGLKNIAGIIELLYAPIEWILNFPEFISDNNTITIPVAFIPGKDWLTLPVIDQQNDYRERQRRNSQTPFYNQTLRAQVSKDSSLKSEQFDFMKDHRFIILYKYTDGSEKLLGSPEYPFKFENNLESGKKPGAFSGHKVAFISQNPLKAPFYNI